MTRRTPRCGHGFDESQPLCPVCRLLPAAMERALAAQDADQRCGDDCPTWRLLVGTLARTDMRADTRRDIKRRLAAHRLRHQPSVEVEVTSP